MGAPSLAGAPAGSIEFSLTMPFWELGRFSVAYRGLFGETPLATLRRPAGDAPQSQIFARCRPSHREAREGAHTLAIARGAIGRDAARPRQAHPK